MARPGGLVAVRDADYAGMTWFPPSHGLDEWRELYHEVTEANGHEADAGRHLLSWVREAGFAPEGIAPGAGAWCYATPEDRSWWAGLWDFPRLSIDIDDNSKISPSLKRKLEASVHEQTGMEIAVGELITEMKHTVTRYRIRLLCLSADFLSGELPDEPPFRWVTSGKLDGYPLSRTGRKLANLLK